MAETKLKENQALKNTNSHFFASNSAATSTGTIIFNTEYEDVGGNYNNATGAYVAPVDGTYLFSYGGITIAAATIGRISLAINGTVYGGNSSQVRFGGAVGTEFDGASKTLVLGLSAGDSITIYCSASGLYAGYGYFSGTLLRET